MRRSEAPSRGVFDRAADHSVAVEVEKESAVLLKNNGILPLKRSSSVVYLGEFAEKPRYQGGGSSHVNAWSVTSALSCAQGNVAYYAGFSAAATKATRT